MSAITRSVWVTGTGLGAKSDAGLALAGCKGSFARYSTVLSDMDHVSKVTRSKNVEGQRKTYCMTRLDRTVRSKWNLASSNQAGNKYDGYYFELMSGVIITKAEMISGKKGGFKTLKWTGTCSLTGNSKSIDKRKETAYKPSMFAPSLAVDGLTDLGRKSYLIATARWDALRSLVEDTGSGDYLRVGAQKSVESHVISNRASRRIRASIFHSAPNDLQFRPRYKQIASHRVWMPIEAGRESSPSFLEVSKLFWEVYLIPATLIRMYSPTILPVLSSYPRYIVRKAYQLDEFKLLVPHGMARQNLALLYAPMSLEAAPGLRQRFMSVQWRKVLYYGSVTAWYLVMLTL
ncbi:hypothetical protein B0H34DRAFT_676951 [Crassisporium funariophilum]|nr:hypothetical protein B0H34DRAFT_676951 [Crassisporium funariophilum]